MATDITFEDLVALGQEAQTAIYERSKAYGTIGRQNSNGIWQIPSGEKNRRLITVTLEDGTEVLADASRVSPLGGAQVWLFREAGQWVIQGDDPRSVSAGATNTTTAITKHNHNIGNPLFTPLDLASLTDGLVLPTGNGLQVIIGRVTYPKADGTIGIYEGEDTLDLATAVSGLNANQQRWVVHYIDRSDGTAAFHSAPAVTGTVNYTTDIETAVADCLSTVSTAYPYAVTKIRAGMSSFGTYKAMQGRSPNTKDMVRLGVMGSPRSNDPWPISVSGALTIASNTQRVVGSYTIGSGGSVTINGKLRVV